MSDENIDAQLSDRSRQLTDTERALIDLDKYYETIKIYYAGMTRDEITRDAKSTSIRLSGLIKSFGGFKKETINLNHIIYDPSIIDPFTDATPEELPIRAVIANIRLQEPEFADAIDALVAVQQTSLAANYTSNNWGQTIQNIINAPFSPKNIEAMGCSPEAAQDIETDSFDLIDVEAHEQVSAFMENMRLIFGRQITNVHTGNDEYLRQQENMNRFLNMFRNRRLLRSELNPIMAAAADSLEALDIIILQMKGVPRIIKAEHRYDKRLVHRTIAG